MEDDQYTALIRDCSPKILSGSNSLPRYVRNKQGLLDPLGPVFMKVGSLLESDMVARLTLGMINDIDEL